MYVEFHNRLLIRGAEWDTLTFVAFFCLSSTKGKLKTTKVSPQNYKFSNEISSTKGKILNSPDIRKEKVTLDERKMLLPFVDERKISKTSFRRRKENLTSAIRNSRDDRIGVPKCPRRLFRDLEVEVRPHQR